MLLLSIIVGLLIVVVCTIWQVRIYNSCRLEIESLARLFPLRGAKEYFTITENDGKQLINAPGNAGKDLNDLAARVNYHLSVDSDTDIASVKELVNARIRQKEEVIDSAMPVPQYIGLGGTLAGIIFGVTLLIFSGDLNVMMNSSAEAGTMAEKGAGNGIIMLLAGVVIAMLTTLVGIWLSTDNSKRMSKASTLCCDNRDDFFDWLQANMKVKRSADLELIDSINKLDVAKTSEANVKVLQELKSCCDEIGRFNQYLHSVGNYIDAMDSLNRSLNQQWIQTGEIEDMAKYFKAQNAQIAARGALMNESVGKVDSVMKKAIEDLGTNSAMYVSALENASNEQMSKLKEFGDEQARIMTEIQSEMRKAVEKQQSDLLDKIQSTSDLADGLKKLPDLQAAIGKLCEQTAMQNGSIERLIEKLDRPAEMQELAQSPAKKQDEFPRWARTALTVSAMIVAAACILSIVRSFI